MKCEEKKNARRSHVHSCFLRPFRFSSNWMSRWTALYRLDQRELPSTLLYVWYTSSLDFTGFYDLAPSWTDRWLFCIVFVVLCSKHCCFLQRDGVDFIFLPYCLQFMFNGLFSKRSFGCGPNLQRPRYGWSLNAWFSLLNWMNFFSFEFLLARCVISVVFLTVSFVTYHWLQPVINLNVINWVISCFLFSFRMFGTEKRPA